MIREGLVVALGAAVLGVALPAVPAAADTRLGEGQLARLVPSPSALARHGVVPVASDPVKTGSRDGRMPGFFGCYTQDSSGFLAQHWFEGLPRRQAYSSHTVDVGNGDSGITTLVGQYPSVSAARSAHRAMAASFAGCGGDLVGHGATVQQGTIRSAVSASAFQYYTHRQSDDEPSFHINLLARQGAAVIAVHQEVHYDSADRPSVSAEAARGLAVADQMSRHYNRLAR